MTGPRTLLVLRKWNAMGSLLACATSSGPTTQARPSRSAPGSRSLFSTVISSVLSARSNHSPHICLQILASLGKWMHSKLTRIRSHPFLDCTVLCTRFRELSWNASKAHHQHDFSLSSVRSSWSSLRANGKFQKSRTWAVGFCLSQFLWSACKLTQQSFWHHWCPQPLLFWESTSHNFSLSLQSWWQSWW